MVDAPLPSLLADGRPGPLGRLTGKALAWGYALSGKTHYDDFRLERVLDMPIVIMPSVANPRLLRTGGFFASQIDRRCVGADTTVLDLGTGSGICALAAARFARRVIGVDVNPTAVRCAAINALLNGLEDRIELRRGDLFTPVAGERFDLVLLNPPFLTGRPRDDRDAAWRSADIPLRFAAGLADHLNPGGAALLVLSSFGDACPVFEAELRNRGFRLEPFARRRYVNETVTIVRATRPEGSA